MNTVPLLLFFDFGMEGFFSESFENITGLSECQLVFDFLGPMVYAQIANPKVVLPTGSLFFCARMPYAFENLTLYLWLDNIFPALTIDQ